MTASTVPSIRPINIAATVSSDVRVSPAMICPSSKYCATTGHWKPGFVATLTRTRPATISASALAAQVHG
jgi:hypothetical protein